MFILRTKIDQQKINKFAALSAQMQQLKEELKVKEVRMNISLTNCFVLFITLFGHATGRIQRAVMFFTE